MPLPRVFFDLSVADQPLGRVVFELFADVVPKTAENFRALCTGEKSTPGKSLAYASSPIHRVIDGFMIQGGDFTKRNGTGGESIYGGTFKDERLEGDGTAVDRKGLLVMANRGPNTNGSQFFVTLAPAGHLTGKHVVFGRVVFGMEHIDAIGKLATDERDRPLSPVIISRAGELELRAAPAPARARSPSPSRASSRSRSRSRSRSISSDSEDERRRRRRERRERKEREREERRAERKRRKERRRRHDSDSEDDSDGDGEPKRSSRSKSPRRRSRRSRSPSETLSELDARLEREEKERLEKERLEKLKEMKAQIERERQAVKDAGGVVYKGRGTMRYRDPETRGSGMPTNFSARGLDTRPRYRRDRGDRERDDAGRWERGGDARPAFERERGKDMDRWDHGGWSSRDEHRDERRDGERERGGERGDRGRDGRDRDGGRGRERDEGEGRPLADRLGGGLDYRDEAERERGPDPRMDPGRAARANAWRSAARRSVSPAPRRSPLPPRHSPSPVMRRSPSRERGRTPGTPSSDMVMDD